MAYGDDFSKAVKKLCQEKSVKLINNFDLIGGQKVIDLNSVGLPSERNRINTPIIAVCGIAPMTLSAMYQYLHIHHHSIHFL